MPTIEQLKARYEWTAALRSGKYKQGKNRLCSQLPEGIDEFCCLGVACEVLGPQVGVTRKVLDSGQVVYVNPDGFHSHDWLPESIKKLLGLNSASGLFGLMRVGDSLAGLNDRGETFANIAGVIEREGSLYVADVHNRSS